MDVVSVIETMGAFLREDHFVYSSGKHGEVYINKNQLALHPELVSRICLQFAQRYKDEGIEVVVGPAIGGIILAQWTAYHLSKLTGTETLSVFAEKGTDTPFTFTRGYEEYLKGKRILLLDDLANSGSTARHIIKATRNCGAEIVAFSVMINRNPSELDSSEIEGVPFQSLCNVDVVAFEASNCPLCAEGREINTRVGHGKNFLESQASQVSR